MWKNDSRATAAQDAMAKRVFHTRERVQRPLLHFCVKMCENVDLLRKRISETKKSKPKWHTYQCSGREWRQTRCRAWPRTWRSTLARSVSIFFGGEKLQSISFIFFFFRLYFYFVCLPHRTYYLTSGLTRAISRCEVTTTSLNTSMGRIPEKKREGTKKNLSDLS